MAERDAWVEAHMKPFLAEFRRLDEALKGRGDLDQVVGLLMREYWMGMVGAAVQLQAQKRLAQALKEIENDWTARGKDPKSYDPEPGKTSYLTCLRRSLMNLGNVLADDEAAPMYEVNQEWWALVRGSRERGADPFAGTDSDT